jgi:hypothetical protein
MSKIFVAVVACVVCACGTKTPSPASQRSLENEANATVREMSARDPDIPTLLAEAPAYAVSGSSSVVTPMPS